MDYKTLLLVFASVFIAELGDKTQLATLLFASHPQASRLAIFLGAAAALIAASAIAVLAGGFISHYLSAKQLSVLAGVGFLAIGIWTLLRA